MQTVRPIRRIVIHCSATPNGDSLFRTAHGAALTPVQMIDDWHRERTFRRDPAARQRFNPSLAAIGYHYVIYTNGAVATGRAEAEVGAHAQGFNTDSLGVCLIGTDRFTVSQWSSLTHLVAGLERDYSRYGAVVCGHGALPGVAKRCPGFDVRAWLQRGMMADAEHVLQPGESA